MIEYTDITNQEVLDYLEEHQKCEICGKTDINTDDLDSLFFLFCISRMSCLKDNCLRHYLFSAV